jgi:hypothetical protein
MLLASCFLLGSAILGAFAIRRLFGSRLNQAEQILWGFVVGWTLSTAVVYLLSRIQGKLDKKTIIALTAVLGIACFILLARAVVQATTQNARLRWSNDFNGLLLVLCLFAPVYGYLFSTHFYAPGPGGVYSGGSASADLNFHAAISTAFVSGNSFPPIYTPHFPDALLYPFMPDFLTAILMASGVSIRSALLITSFPLALVTTGLIFSFALRLKDSQPVAVVATILFLLNGGLGFIDLIRDWWATGKPFLVFWNSMGVNYANYSDHGLHWPNIITDVFVPQRTSLFGLPITLIVLTVFAVQWKNGNGRNGSEFRLFAFAGLLTGLLPWFHVHSFIAVGLISIFLFLLRPARGWLMFWIPAVAIASWPISGLIAHASGGIVRFQLGWMGHAATFFPWYLVRNLGLPLLLAIPSLWLIEREWRKFYVAFILILVFALTVVVSPNVFDNGKFIYYWHILNSVLVANLLVKLFRQYRQRVAAMLLGIICVLTGVTALKSESLLSELVFTNEDLAAAEFVRTQTLPDSVFLTAPVTNQPVLSLAGRRIVRGPTAWLWSHGLEFRDREADVRRIYRGESDAQQLLSHYGVDYIFVGDAERNLLNANQAFLNSNCSVVYQNSKVTIYATNEVNKNGPFPGPRELATRVSDDPFALLTDFRRTSFFVYRTWLVTTGRIPTRDEFLHSMILLGDGLFIGAPGWEEKLETNRSIVLTEINKEIGPETNEAYLDRLIKNASLSRDSGFRAELLAGLNNQTESRLTALNRVVEASELYQREYNTAFVLVHYFGYLGRNPGDGSDKGLEGLNYWRTILDESGDYRSISRAFLESDEYRKR